MFRAACSPRTVLFTPLRGPSRSVFSRSLSEDSKEAIIQRLLQEKPITHIDELTYKKKQQFDAAIRGVVPIVKKVEGNGRNLPTRLPPGQHLLYFNTVAPTEQLLPDGTDTAHSPPSPWSRRLWAGGRIQFPQHSELDLIDSPKLVLIEYVRDVRITGTEGQEKIFVKIERRVGKRLQETTTQGARHFAHSLRRSTEDNIVGSLVVETRDLCFLRENSSTVPFQRRHITPPTMPDYSHSLTPTPALLFRFSALTYNAHAIHIDPEYTRKVYGFPNLLVHGPLGLTLMLEYMRQILLALPGRDYSPVITEINYRNLAPLFANEEMTICVKRKRRLEPAQSSPTTLIAESSAEPTKEVSPPSAGETDSVVSFEDESRKSEKKSPPRTKVTESGIDIGKGFPMPPSGEDSPVSSEQDDYSDPKFKTSVKMPSQGAAASDEIQYPQEWEVWIQTGQGDAASLAVRGTVRVEAFDRAKQILTKSRNLDLSSGKQQKRRQSLSVVEDVKSYPSGLTSEEVEMLEKVKSMLDKKGTGDGHAKLQPSSKQRNSKSPTPVIADTPGVSTTESEEASLPISKISANPTNEPPKLFRYSSPRTKPMR